MNLPPQVTLRPVVSGISLQLVTYTLGVEVMTNPGIRLKRNTFPDAGFNT